MATTKFGLNQLKFNKQTYAYVIPISQQFYDEINHDILNKSNNDKNCTNTINMLTEILQKNYTIVILKRYNF